MFPVRQTALARQAVFAALVMAMVSGGAGCGLPRPWQVLAKKLPEATPDDPAYYMLCIWESSEGVGVDGLPTRGFAGQISFFTRKKDSPVRVNGDVRVYVFDDQGPEEDRGKPFHQWDFLGDAWAIHLHDGTLGPTYSVFIPYSRKGNHHAQCALRVRFTPENGSPIYSDTVAVLLPGPLRKKENKPISGEGSTEKRTSLNSLTIPLKEKRKTELANMPLGHSEMQQTVVPVSELATQRQGAAYGQPIPAGGVPGTASSPMMTLPSAPQHYNPPAPSPQTLMEDPSAQPILPTNPPGTSAFPKFSNPPTIRQRPGSGNGF